MAEGRLQWHPAFSAALHIELEDDLNNLYIEEEHILGEKPMQILITKELSKKENYWLQSLRNNLKAGTEVQELLGRYEKKKHGAYYPELMDLIVHANWKLMKEEKEMCEALRELFADELKESREEGLESGLKQGLQNGLELAKNMFRMFRAGASPEEIAEECGLPVEQVREMLE